MKKPNLYMLVFLLLGIPQFQLFCQETKNLANEAPGKAGEDAVFIPFISNIDAELKNGFIRISWTDSPDVAGPVYIFRSTEPIHASSKLPRPVEVPYGVQSYIDETENPGTLYYFVAASDERGKSYTVIIPATNTLSVTLGEEDLGGFALSGLPGGVEKEKPGITDLKAYNENDAIMVTFQGDGEETLLYRSTKPIRKQEDLMRAIIVRQGPFSPVTDYPVPGISYYYAIISEKELGSGDIRIKAGVNATGEAAEVPLGINRPGLSPEGIIVRAMPIPAMTSAAAAIPAPVMSGRAGKAADAIAGYEGKKGSFREPGVFLEDLEAPATGEAALLRLIVHGSFGAMNWEKAGEELRMFLSLPHSAPVTSRSRFYLGQTYYFTGKPKEALFEFLASQSQYPNESNPWIDAALSRLTN